MCGLHCSSSHLVEISVHKIKSNCVIESAKCGCDGNATVLRSIEFRSDDTDRQTDRPFAGQDVPKISEIACNLQQISSDSSLIPWISRMFALCIKRNLTFHCMSVQYDKHMFIITNTMHTIGVDKITLFKKPLKTTYYLLHVTILIGSSSGRSIPCSRSYYVGLLTGKVTW